MNELKALEYHDIRVITSNQLAEAYGTTNKQISQAFNRNKDRYVEGKHYFLLRGNELKSFRLKAEMEGNGVKMALWTQRGALLIAKSIDTDTAWDAYEGLVDFYFDRKEETRPMIAAKENVPFPERSSTPLPKRPDWYQRNCGRIKKICNRLDIEHKELYHVILSNLGRVYDLKAVNEIYFRERGYYPEYAIDIVGYFPELEEAADLLLDKLGKK